MASVSVVVANYKGADVEFDISAHIDAGNDVVFTNEDGSERDMPFLQCSSDANIRTRRSGQSDAQGKGFYFIAGGWHEHTFCKVFAGSTSASAEIIGKAR